MIHNKENEYRKVLEALALRFASGNSVPVERSMITRDEYDLLVRAFNDLVICKRNLSDIRDERDCQIGYWR